MMRVWGALLSGLLLALPALAAPARQRVLLDGPKKLQGPLRKALGKRVAAVGARPALRADPSEAQVRQACARAKAQAALLARTRPDKGWRLQVHACATGQLVETLEVPPQRRKPPRALPKGTQRRLAQALAQASRLEAPAPPPVAALPEPAPALPEPAPAPVAALPEPAPAPVATRPEPPPAPVATRPEPAPAPVAARPTREQSPEEWTPPSRRPVALRLGVGGRAFSRRFGFSDDLFGALARYRLALGPAALVEAEWYPAAHFSGGALANVGLLLSGDQAVGLSSVGPEGTLYSTRARRLRGALGVRLRLGPAELTPFAGVMLQEFAVERAAGTALNLPNVEYRGARAGLALRLPVAGPLGLTAQAAGQYLLSSGEVASQQWFPRLKVGGLDAAAGFTFALGQRLEARLTADYTRHWFSMNPEPGDPFIAGGALDYTVGSNLSLSFVL